MASYDVPSNICQAPHDGGPGMSRLRKLLAGNAAVEVAGGAAVLLDPGAVFPGIANGGFPGCGLPDIARHVIGCHSTQETRIQNAF